MIAECVNRNTSDFRIFSGKIVLGDERLDLVAHGLIERDLSCDRGPARCFRAASCFENGATISSRNATQLSRALAFRERPVKPSFESSDRRSLLACNECSLTTNVTS
jgi:hypothetical protein